MIQHIVSWLTPFLWVLLLSYAVFTMILCFLWTRIPSVTSIPSQPSDYLSIIIPVRNEALNIGNLLTDLENQNFPTTHFEVIVVNDSSTDRTPEIVNQRIAQSRCNIRLITLPNTATSSPKKRAIETAIKIAKGNLIVSTDGDCRAGAGWLQAIADCHLQTGAKLISGPVTFFAEQSVPDHLQTVEFSSLIGSGASSMAAGFPSMCNGANLAYEKAAFDEVGGYEGVRHIASGDDEFLMHKIAARFRGGVRFLKSKDAIVSTGAHREWDQFFRQRKRWASKWKHYQSKTPLILALYVFLCNFSLIVAGAMFLFGALSTNTFIGLLLIKCAPEWLFLGTVLRFLNKSASIFFIPLTQLIYPFYVCFFGLVVQNPEYEWKGRKLT